MKKVLVSAILGLAAIASVQAQSSILLYNYGTPSAGSIVYGQGAGSSGAAVTGGYTVGVYYALGNVAAAVNSSIGGATTQSGLNVGSLVGSGVTLGTGVGSTVALGPDGPGVYDSTAQFAVPGASGDAIVTLVLVAYNGASYEASVGDGLYRGHSAAFTMTALNAPAFALFTGNFASGFAVAPVPEPSTFALAGLGLASLLIFRRRK